MLLARRRGSGGPHGVQRRDALAERRPTHLIADKGCDTEAIRNTLTADGIRATIPPRSHSRTPIRWNRRLYRERNRIERMIGHLKINRAIVIRYDKCGSLTCKQHLARPYRGRI